MKEAEIRGMDKLIAIGTPAFRIQLTSSGFNVQKLINGSYKDITFFYDTDLLEDQKNWVEAANLEIMECTRRMMEMYAYNK